METGLVKIKCRDCGFEREVFKGWTFAVSIHCNWKKEEVEDPLNNPFSRTIHNWVKIEDTK